MCASKPCAIFSTRVSGGPCCREIVQASYVRHLLLFSIAELVVRACSLRTNLCPILKGRGSTAERETYVQSKCVRFPSPETRLTPSVHSRSIGELQPRSCRLSGNQEVH